jgi:CubicO group peptidase (beta-lactamase class C family)
MFILLLMALLLASPAACAGKKDNPAANHSLRDLSQTGLETDDYWVFAAPRSEGMDPGRLEEMLTAIDKGSYNIHSLTVVRNGKIVMDCYGTDWKHDRTMTPGDLHELHSVTKSVTSLLLGIAIGEGKIPGVDSRVMSWFPDDGITNLKSGKMDLTLEDLLTMRSGLDWTEGSDDSLFFDPAVTARVILGRPMTSAPGTVWGYSSGNSQILGEILRRATGKTPAAYADEKLFGPLGITKYKWSADHSGTSYGGWGLFLRSRDMARIGWLCLQGGLWEGRRIVPSDWLETATARHTATPWDGGGYGYHWWTPFMGGFAARGYEGQMIYVFPEKKLVVVFTSKLDNMKAVSILDGLVSKYILPSIDKD